jgi:hypothetical protein
MGIMDSTENLPANGNLTDYGPEVLCASWNPVVTALAEPAGGDCREFIAELASVDVESFLSRFYRWQQG